MIDDIASLVGSRICHDLISPIGAISNGVELIGMTQGTDGAEMSLINDSVLNANARIRFFRVAYGSATPDQMMSRKEILSILSDQARGGRLTYYWQIDDDIKRLEARAVFLLLQCFESALPRGGDIVVSANGPVWSMIASGPQLRWDAAHWDSFNNSFAQVEHTAALVQFALVPQALREVGRQIEVVVVDNKISANLRPLPVR